MVDKETNGNAEQEAPQTGAAGKTNPPASRARFDGAKQFIKSKVATYFIAPPATGVLSLLIIILGSVLVSAWLGYFGESLKTDVTADDPNLKMLRDHQQTDRPVRLWDPGQGKYVQNRRPELCLKFDSELDQKFLLDPGITVEGTKLYPDARLVASLRYLCERHRHLRISHLVSAYIDMEFDPESQQRKPQIFKNVSAHKKGQAVDITEIDYVTCGSFIFAKTYPVEIKKQDPPPSRVTGGSGAGLPGLPIPGTRLGDVAGIFEQEAGLPQGTLGANPNQTALQGLLRLLEQEMGVGIGTIGPDGSFVPNRATLELIERETGISLKGNNSKEILEETAKRLLERQWGLPSGTLQTLQPKEIAEKVGLRELEKQWGLAPGTLSLSDGRGNLERAGKQKVEALLGLPRGTLSGISLSQTRDNTLLRRAEENMGLKPGSLQKPGLVSLLNNVRGEQIDALFGLPPGSGQEVKGFLANNDEGGAFEALGSRVLGWQLGADPAQIRRAFKGEISWQEAVKDSRAVRAVADQYGVPHDVAARLLEGKGSSNDFWDIGAGYLAPVLGIPKASLLDAVNGRQSWEETLGSSRYVQQLEQAWRLPGGTITKLLTGGLTNPGATAQDWGGRILDSYLGLAPGRMNQALSGQADLLDVLLESKFVTETASRYGLDVPTIRNVLDGKEPAEKVGWRIAGAALGLSQQTVNDVIDGRKTVANALLESSYVKTLEAQTRVPPGTFARLLAPASPAERNAGLENMGMNLLNGYLGLEPYDPQDSSRDQRFSIQNVLNGKKSAVDVFARSMLAQRVEAQLGLPPRTIATLLDTKDPVEWRRKAEDIGARLLERRLGLPVDSFLQVLRGERSARDLLFSSPILREATARFGVPLDSFVTVVSGEVNDPETGRLRAATTEERATALKDVGSGIVGRMMDQTLGLPAGASREAVRAALDGDYSKAIDLAGSVMDKRFGLPAGTMKEIYLATQSGNWARVERIGFGLIEQRMGLPQGTMPALKEGLTTGNWANFTNIAVGFALSQIDQSLGLPSGTSYGLYLLLTTGNPAGLVAVAVGSLLGGIFGGSATCQRDAAREKVHTTIKELLQFPTDENNIDLRVTQLITYSHERDVAPFETDGTLDKVYGRGRSRNFGLFAMDEAWDHLHIAY